jgi:hypothetical protein
MDSKAYVIDCGSLFVAVAGGGKCLWAGSRPELELKMSAAGLAAASPDYASDPDRNRALKSAIVEFVADGDPEAAFCRVFDGYLGSPFEDETMFFIFEFMSFGRFRFDGRVTGGEVFGGWLSNNGKPWMRAALGMICRSGVWRKFKEARPRFGGPGAPELSLDKGLDNAIYVMDRAAARSGMRWRKEDEADMVKAFGCGLFWKTGEKAK